jgi:hypothetical protein
MAIHSVTVTVTITVPPLRRFVDEGIAEIGPAIAIGVLATPSVAT